ncbi:GNAT family N-acetyltransferase [Candidatus Thorarchaeota archaeon]|nr:MAG: GNAT family N-acetyltransferase [Candidatus Thorarchaeota archaeon]
MNFNIRIANARDRNALEQFYNREGFDFQGLSLARAGSVSETMFIIATADDVVVAALKLDIREDSEMGRVGIIRNFEIEDQLESSEVGPDMLQEALSLARERALRALETAVNVNREDVIQLYRETGFSEEGQEVLLRKDFKARIFG